MTSGTAVADDEGWFDDWIQTEIEIDVVASPPDRVSGGDARVVISLPFFVSRSSIRILLNAQVGSWKNEPEPDMHNSHQSFAARQRLLDYNGDASNQVVWFTDKGLFDQTPMAFSVIDEWMRNIKENPAHGVADNKPAAAADSCFDETGTSDLFRKGRLGRPPRWWTAGALHFRDAGIFDLAHRGGCANRRRHLQMSSDQGWRRRRGGSRFAVHRTTTIRHSIGRIERGFNFPLRLDTWASDSSPLARIANDGRRC